MEWPLTVERLVEATGAEYLERVEKLDMIFEKISNTDALSRYARCRPCALPEQPLNARPGL